MNTLKIKNSIFKVFIELFIWNKKLRSKVKSRWAKLHLKRHVKLAIENTSLEDAAISKTPKIIWQYWHQGLEDAPLIIKKCLDSVKKYHPDYDIRVVTFDTIKDYVQIPQKYYDLLEQKNYSIAHFSDVLRLYLLSQYGGVWIDSTIYLTGRIPEDILNADFFAFQKDPKTDNFEDKMTCFFITSKQNGMWVNLIKSAIESYWLNNNYLIHYFIFEHIVTMISNSNKELQTSWNNMPYYSADITGKLQDIMFEQYDKSTSDEIKALTNIHKLTYKNVDKHETKNTYFEKIVSEGI